MHFGSRRQQAIDQRQRIRNSQQRPGFRDRLVDRQDAPSESGPHLQKPSIERFGLLWITPPFQLDTMADFGEHEHARPNVLDRCAGDPMDNVWMGAVALADF